jgi:hypothetical protein
MPKMGIIAAVSNVAKANIRLCLTEIDRCGNPNRPGTLNMAMLLAGFAGVGFITYRRKSKPALMAA